MEIKKEMDIHSECMTYDNHSEPLDTCRCCFKIFDEDENQLKITKMIIMRFMEITQIEVKINETYNKIQLTTLIFSSKFQVYFQVPSVNYVTMN